MTAEGSTLVGPCPQNAFKEFPVRPPLRGAKSSGHAMQNLIEPLHLIDLLRIRQLLVGPDGADADSQVVRERFVEASATTVIQRSDGFCVFGKLQNQSCSIAIT